MAEITIYGASDDLIEVEGAVRGEAYLLDRESLVILTAPDGATLAFMVGFCSRNPDGWSIAVESHGRRTPPWPIRFVPRPDSGGNDDPAVVIDAPGGTVVTCDGEPIN